MNAWFKDIDRAKSGADVVASARDYCSLLHPRELEALPDEYRNIRIEGEVDIPRLRAQLSDGYARVKGDAIESERLRQLVDYFARASDRLGELHAAG